MEDGGGAAKQGQGWLLQSTVQSEQPKSASEPQS
eukprot:CAMPEP_0115507252 /NCGR_PEP_ID=MMETSP0271-20121206/71621_1 /TAXON_ID=71861 /ORGANISM="Scrippsiella trochoidea, Strain CCMP3099" /LENGTH=33 /DNA_ID= /DNA_START= /DNA_END= /DNA_ORIENTATION=